MKTFAGNKSLKAIKAQCVAQGVTFDDRMYRKQGSDHVVVEGGGCRVLFSTFNGNFFGTTPDGTTFDSRETLHEDEPWFQALLSFFYVEAEPASAT